MSEPVRTRVHCCAHWTAVLLLVVPWTVACGSQPEPPALRLVDRFAEARVENTAATQPDLPRIDWVFEGESGGTGDEDSSPARGWKAIHDVRGLTVRNGHLVGRAGALPILAAPGLESPDASDFFHALELKLRVSKGTRLGVSFVGAEKLDVENVVKQAKESAFADFNVDLRPGDELETYTITTADASFNTSYPLRTIRHVLLRFVGMEGGELEIASMSLVTLKEHLASIPSGVGWQGLADVFRETIVARSPERITFDVDLPSDPWLDLAIGTVANGPVTFQVTADSGGARSELLRRTVSTPNRWQTVPVELEDLAGRRVALSFTIEAEKAGLLGRPGRPQPGRPAPRRAPHPRT
jgi:hypothetical protein